MVKEKITYSYDKLKGRIREKRLTYKEFAEKIGISETGLYNIFKNKYCFRQENIDRSKKLLDIPDNEVWLYFFNH